MPTSTVILDTPELQIVETTSLPERDPSLPGGWRGRNVVWKPGSSGANERDILDKLRVAFDTNQAFLAIANPTNAQVVAWCKAAARELNGIIKYVRGDLGDTAGT